MKSIVLFLGVSSMALTGCVAVPIGIGAYASLHQRSIGNKVDPDKLAQVKKGMTTRQQVIDLLGSPDRMEKSGNDTVFTYAYTDLGSAAGAWVKSNMSQKTQTVIITLDSHDMVKDIASSYN